MEIPGFKIKTKNTKTHLKWKDMPGLGDHPNLSGPMTAREVMQFVGTDIFRKMYGDVWAEGTIKRILKEKTELAVICDCRFPNEVAAVQKAQGKVIRFTRSPYREDQHASEVALDNYDGFDAILDNANMSISEQNQNLYEILRQWDYVQKLQYENLEESQIK